MPAWCLDASWEGLGLPCWLLSPSPTLALILPGWGLNLLRLGPEGESNEYNSIAGMGPFGVQYLMFPGAYVLKVDPWNAPSPPPPAAAILSYCPSERADNRTFSQHGLLVLKLKQSPETRRVDLTQRTFSFPLGCVCV